jgi:SAM-dependent methyltransferase
LSLEERANAGLHPHILEKIESLQADKTSRIVDVGCGSGAMLHRLADRGYTNLYGLDIEPPRQGRAGITFIECDLDARFTPFDDESVDLALSVEVFEHIENIGSLLAELSRILSPGGRILATTPNLHSLEARLRYLLSGKLKQFDAIGDPTHILPIFLLSFERILHRHGFAIAHTWGFPLDGSSPTSRRGLRIAATVLHALGVRAAPAGDQLCMLIQKRPEPTLAEALSKQASLTSHYRRADGPAQRSGHDTL